MRKSFYLNLFVSVAIIAFLIFACKKKVDTTPEEIKGSPNVSASTTGASTTGASTTGGTTTGGTTTGGTTTGGTTTGGTTTGGPQYGAIIFYKPTNCYNSITLYFEGSYEGVLGPSARQSNPTCNTNGCIVMTNLLYGSYSYYGQVYAADQTTVLYTEYGSVNLNAPCVGKSVNPH
jgi:hypothetical protein